MENRYSFGGDEHIFVEVNEEMSLEAFFKSLSITTAVKEADIKGVTEICPANASFQIKFDPDVIKPDDMLAELKDKISVGSHVDGLKVGPEEDILLLTSRKNKTVQILLLDFIQDIDISNSPFKGPADAPVEIAVFSDFQ